MGRAKEMMILADEIGWMPNHDDKFVCERCIEDDALGQVVAQHAQSKQCSYCARRSRKAIAAPLDSVTEHMAICINREYCDPAEVLPYDEGAYVGDTFGIDGVFEEIGFWVEDEALMDDIQSSFVRELWCKENWLTLDPAERKFSGWEAFKEVVKHLRRYTFWSMDDPHEEKWHPDYMPVGKTLEETSQAVREAGIIKTVPAGKRIWRVRIHGPTERLASEAEFTTPPTEKATKPNRMSPAGVPMFYGADDFRTAFKETLDASATAGQKATGACFETLIPLSLLDLADLPPVPSFFDHEHVEMRQSLVFLTRFARDLAEPVKRDAHEHIEYVPTQAFTEYVRWEMKTSDGEPIHGIRYQGSVTGKACYVLFCNQDECLAKPRPQGVRAWLKFVPESLRTA
ncbi:MAG: RES domain-containing protein [Spirochaetes bacterium]|nr:RES domain-containing protein [Spirochaetota bacterium]